MAKGLKISYDNVGNYFYIKNEKGNRISTHSSFKSAIEYIKKIKMKNSEVHFPSYCLGSSNSSNKEKKVKKTKLFSESNKKNTKLIDFFNEMMEN